MTSHLPPFAIIGAQRARSTTLLDLVRQHPSVRAPTGEFGYFEDPFWVDRDPAELRRITQPPGTGVVGGFKRPELLGRPECPPRMAAELPDLRMIAVLREPVARTISAYFHYMRVGILPLRPIEEGLARILAGESRTRQGLEVIGFSLYGECLARLLERFPLEQVLVLTDADLDRDLDATMGAVWRHLGVPPAPVIPEAGTGRSTGTYAPPRIRTQRIGSALQYRVHRPTGLRHPRRGIAPRAANRLVAEIDSRLVRPFVHDEPPRLSPALATALCERLAPDVARLEQLVGRDLEGWPARPAAGTTPQG